MELVKRYTDFSELTTPMLNEFVDKVVVHEADKSSGVREQRVDIFLNYIGQFEVSEEYDGLTDAERAEKKALEEKRASRHKYHREWAAKNKEKLRLQAEQEQQQSQTPAQELPEEKTA